MCGIAGIVGESTGEIKRITAAIAHRGPDQNGFFEDNGIALGHRRLSIIDLSEKAKQPMCNEDGSVWVVFNGEIYNFEAVRRELEAGHAFKSNSDTEVLVHGYEEWGVERLVQKIKGDFAFAVWDGELKRLVLARDRVGVKPLYYAFVGGDLVFASEPKAILSHGGFKPKLNRAAFDEFLAFRYVPWPETLFEGIKKIPPASYAVFDGGNFFLRKYWDFVFMPVSLSENALVEATRRVLRNAVRRRLMSDVPLGAFLSGGLDSSYVVALMAEASDKVRTFSVGFNHASDETPFARSVADLFSTVHKEIVVDASPGVLPDVTWHLDEPVADIAALPTYLMSRETKKSATVVLTGDGGDEVFGGYPRYVWLPKLLATPLAGVASKASFLAGFAKGGKFAERLGEALDAAGDKDKAKVFLAYAAAFSGKEKRELYENLEGWEESALRVVRAYFSKTGRSFLEDLLYFDLKTLLPDDYLMKVDKTTMAWGVESRVPFLDEELLQTVAEIPSGLKVKSLKTKHFMRKVVRDKLPARIVGRRKQGFNVPTGEWLEGELGEIAEQFLSKESIGKRRYFKHDAVQKILASFKRSPGVYGRQFWALFSFELWHRMYLDGSLTRSKAALGF